LGFLAVPGTLGLPHHRALVLFVKGVLAGTQDWLANSRLHFPALMRCALESVFQAIFFLNLKTIKKKNK